jgi:hypothetical protein
MAKPKTVQLSPKHWKALELIEEGSLPIKTIAATVGWQPMTLYDLMSGNTARTGSVGELFYSELKKQHSRNVSKVKHLFKDTQRLALIKLNQRLRELQELPPSKDTTAEITKIMNSLGKAGPSVEITNNSLTYTRGMTPDELRQEFSRLGTLARSALDGAGVSSPVAGRSRALPASDVGGSEVSEES